VDEERDMESRNKSRVKAGMPNRNRQITEPISHKDKQKKKYLDKLPDKYWRIKNTWLHRDRTAKTLISQLHNAYVTDKKHTHAQIEKNFIDKHWAAYNEQKADRALKKAMKQVDREREKELEILIAWSQHFRLTYGDGYGNWGQSPYKDKHLAEVSAEKGKINRLHDARQMELRKNRDEERRRMNE